jgi:hypothetical protein
MIGQQVDVSNSIVSFFKDLNDMMLRALPVKSRLTLPVNRLSYSLWRSGARDVAELLAKVSLDGQTVANITWRCLFCS